MSFTINYAPWIQLFQHVGDDVLETIQFTFYEGQAVALDHFRIGYAFVYTLGWIVIWLGLFLLGVVVLWISLVYAKRKTVDTIKWMLARRYVKDLKDVKIDCKLKENASVGKVYHNDDGTSIFVRDGKVVDLGEVFVTTPKAVAPIHEMAMPTSAFIPSSDEQVTTSGVMSVRGDGIVIGMASCIGYTVHGPCLVTAAHVWSEVWKADKPTLEHNGKIFPISFEWKILLESSPNDLDIVVVAVPHQVFSVIGVKKLASGPLHSSGRCTVFGFNQSGKYGLSSGRLEHKPNEAFRLRHYASTDFGFSGSPLLYNGRVVGVHTGAEVTLNGNCNVGTAFFWEDNRDIETPRKGVATFELQEEELDGKPERVVKFNTVGKTYAVEQLGRKVRLVYKPKQMDYDAPMTFDNVLSNWADEVDAEWETAPRPKSPVDVVESEKEEDFPQGERSPVNKLEPTLIEKRILCLMREMFQTSNSSSESQSITSVKTQKKRKRKVKKVVSDLSTSDAVPIASMAVLIPSLPASTEPLKTGQISQSGRVPLGGPTASSGASSSRPVDSEVRVVRFTRRQEKLYNRVCQSRKYRQLWVASGSAEKTFLREKLLEFVLSSNINLREKQVQDFLAQFSLETTLCC
jgi:hypothetical protein